MQVVNVTDQQKYEKNLSAWEREQERQKVEFTITEKDLDADMHMPSPEVRHLRVLPRSSDTFLSHFQWMQRQAPQARDGTGSPGHGSSGQRFWPGRVGSRVSVSDPMFDPVLSFNVRVYPGVVSTE